uniref:Uncharacterized protein n=1 Tax=Anser brachyrhynchus TaxID=132585 RepID=A0A8B9BFU2_9AVES
CRSTGLRPGPGQQQGSASTLPTEPIHRSRRSAARLKITPSSTQSLPSGRGTASREQASFCPPVSEHHGWGSNALSVKRREQCTHCVKRGAEVLSLCQTGGAAMLPRRPWAAALHSCGCAPFPWPPGGPLPIPEIP